VIFYPETNSFLFAPEKNGMKLEDDPFLKKGVFFCLFSGGPKLLAVGYFPHRIFMAEFVSSAEAEKTFEKLRGAYDVLTRRGVLGSMPFDAVSAFQIGKMVVLLGCYPLFESTKHITPMIS